MSKLIVCPSCGKTEFEIWIQPNNYWTAECININCKRVINLHAVEGFPKGSE
jgi:hypothetical protein